MNMCAIPGDWLIVLLVTPLWAAAAPFDVRSFGTKGDGLSIDSPAINRAIEAAAAGGGTVLFPAGDYLCFSIWLKSRVALYLDAGGAMMAAEPPADLSTGDPEPGDSGIMPAWGLWARHVRTLSLDRVGFRVTSEDLRSVVGLDNVERVRIGRAEFTRHPDVQPLAPRHVRELRLRDCDGVPDTK